MTPEKNIYTLSTILKGIREYLEARIKGKNFWLRVEIAKVTYHPSGHCYLELAETRNGQNIAQCKGAIWSSNLKDIAYNLGSDLNNVLKQGNEILCYVELEFTERYGLNINIKNIDVSFNLGAMEKKKQETIDRLRKEEIIDLNKKHTLPLVIQNIAIIGSPETAGITDLLKTLSVNPYKFQFFVTTYSCSVQGEKAESEIISRLSQLNDSNYDVIALIRGGGSKLDLDVFNSYNIARAIALHTRPVFTGIGHETDLSVADLVANVSHKTPSALGGYIVDRAYNFYVRFMTSFNNIIEYKKHFLEDRKSKLRININDLTNTATSYTRLRRGDLHQSLNRLNTEVRQHINAEKNYLSLALELLKVNPLYYITSTRYAISHTLELIQLNSSGAIKQSLTDFKFKLDYILSYSLKLCEEKTKLINNIALVLPSFNPVNILNKGYAIPRFKGDLLSEQSLQPNDQLELELKNKFLLVSFLKYKEKWKS